jgi:hypothetical protein
MAASPPRRYKVSLCSPEGRGVLAKYIGHRFLSTAQHGLLQRRVEKLEGGEYQARCRWLEVAATLQIVNVTTALAGILTDAFRREAGYQ